MTDFDPALADRIDDVLPQTQCTKCGHDGCRPYAEAMAAGRGEINRCPPGGAAGIRRLSQVTGRPIMPLNPINGVERPLHVAIIDESLCIGCTLCIQACPVDAIVGAARVMHSVVAEWCNGCDLCMAPCPMDCIAMVPLDPSREWSDSDACDSRARYRARLARLEIEREARETLLLDKARARLGEFDGRGDLPASEAERKRAVVQAAIERARTRREAAAKQ